MLGDCPDACFRFQQQEINERSEQIGKEFDLSYGQTPDGSSLFDKGRDSDQSVVST